MDDSLLSLKWHNHQTTFFKSLGILHQQGNYSDVTLACDGTLFPAHRLVLSTCSDYLSAMLQTTHCKCPVIVLKDVKKHQLTSLLRYMYLGEVDVKQSDLAGLIKAAECLEIKGLAVPDQPLDEKGKVSSSSASNEDYKSSNRNSSNKRLNHSPESKDKESNKKQCLESNHKTRNDNHSKSSTSESNIKQEKDDDLAEIHLDDYEITEIKAEPRDCKDISWDQLDDRGEIENNILGELNDFSQNISKNLPGTSHEGESPGDWGASEDEFSNLMYNNCDQVDQSMIPVDDQHNLMEGNMNPVIGENMNSLDLSPLSSIPVQLKDGSIVKMFSCLQCRYMTRHKHNLVHHVRIHSGDKPFKCKLCNYETSFPSSLKRHMAVHTKEKRFECMHCPYKCSQKTQLSIHYTKNH